jgi:hypothetical protein
MPTGLPGQGIVSQQYDSLRSSGHFYGMYLPHGLQLAHGWKNLTINAPLFQVVHEVSRLKNLARLVDYMVCAVGSIVRFWLLLVRLLE